MIDLDERFRTHLLASSGSYGPEIRFARRNFRSDSNFNLAFAGAFPLNRTIVRPLKGLKSKA